jgi:KaiC/GvpD/RAD55 family RecA-like ATPase
MIGELSELKLYVEYANDFSEALWECFFDAELRATDLHDAAGRWYEVSRSAIERRAQFVGHDLANFWKKIVDFAPDYLRVNEETVTVQLSAMIAPTTLSNDVAAKLNARDGRVADFDILKRHHVRYIVMRRLRERYEIDKTSEFVSFFSSASKLMNSRIAEKCSGSHLGDGQRIDLHAATLMREIKDLTSRRNMWHAAFVAICREVRYIAPDMKRPEDVSLRTREFDTEYLLSVLFGLPTAIEGLDQLFGGGGIAFSETRLGCPVVPGRALLIKGRFGSGKTSLSLQLCCEIAKKGGIASYLSLEQQASDCEYSLHSLGLLGDGSLFSLSTDAKGFVERLSELNDIQGHLSITGMAKDGLDEFLSSLVDEVDVMSEQWSNQFADMLGVGRICLISNRLRILAVDSLNAVYTGYTDDHQIVRSLFSNAIQTAKSHGVNLIIVAEDRFVDDHSDWFEENVVDYVIRLSESTDHGYSRRWIQVEKSRLQRESRGRHSYAIRSPGGFEITPSSWAVSGQNSTRVVKGPRENTNIRFGQRSIDRLLGNGFTERDANLYRGDAIALHGPSGTFKTELAMSFLTSLQGDNNRIKCRSLYVTPRDPEASVQYEIAKEYRRAGGQRRDRTEISVISLDDRDNNAATVLQRILNAYAEAARDRVYIDRVVIANVSHWGLTSPGISEDHRFPDVLVNLFRSRETTALYICADRSEHTPLQAAVVDSADCVMQMDRISYRGRSRISIRIVKSRAARHSRELHELDYDQERGLSVRQCLLRQSASGYHEPLPIRLFLHSESDSQTEYNTRWRDRLRATLGTDIDVERQSRMTFLASSDISDFSSADELHIYQLDEYECPLRESGSSSGTSLLKLHPLSIRREIGKQFLDRYTQSKYKSVLPFYADIGFLARDDEKYAMACERFCKERNAIESWEALGEMAALYEQSDKSLSGEKTLFFDFPHVTPENYNCFFLEILFSLAKVEEIDDKDPVELFRHALACKALKIFWQLASGGYKRDLERTLSKGKLVDVADRLVGVDGSTEVAPVHDSKFERPIRVESNCIIWRHWFSTLNQMLSERREVDLSEIVVSPLPNHVSIAGEWYLGIPSQSVAKEFAERLIKDALSPQHEMERLRRGVGLPIRKSFYESRDADDVVLLGPYIQMKSGELRRVIDNARARSSIRGYSRWNRSLSQSLQFVLRSCHDSDFEPDGKARSVLSDLIRSIDLALNG